MVSLQKTPCSPGGGPQNEMSNKEKNDMAAGGSGPSPPLSSDRAGSVIVGSISTSPVPLTSYGDIHTVSDVRVASDSSIDIDVDGEDEHSDSSDSYIDEEKRVEDFSVEKLMIEYRKYKLKPSVSALTPSQKRMERRLKQIDEETRECLAWHKSYDKAYEAPTPKYLLVEDNGRRKYSKEDVMKRTAWMGSAINKPRDALPEMRRVTIKGKQYISVTAQSPSVAKKLLQITRLGPCAVVIYKDPVKNLTYGVLRDEEGHFDGMADETVEQSLRQDGVVKAERLTTWYKEQKVESRSLKLTFDTLICPLAVYAGNRRFNIKEFIPPPLRCFKCQKYEHNVYKCRAKECICQRCGEVGHQAKTYENRRLIFSCNKEKKCANCGGNHEAGFRDCSVHKAYKRINEIMVNQKVTRQEAKERVMPRDNRRTDAEVVFEQQQGREQEALARQQRREQEVQADQVRREHMLQQQIEREEKKEKARDERLNAAIERMVTLSTRVEARLDSKEQQKTEGTTGTEVEKLRTEMESRFRNLETKIAEQADLITKLTEENENLKKEKEAEKAEKEKAQSEVRKMRLAAVEREKRLVEMEKRELAWKAEESEINSMECGEKDNERKRSISDPETETKETKKLDTKTTVYSSSQTSGRGRHKQINKSNIEPERRDEGGGEEDNGGK